MKPLSFLTSLVLLATCNFAQAELKIAGDTKVAPYKLVRLSASGADAKAGIIWRVTPNKDIDKAKTAKDKLEFVAPPGAYVVEAMSVKLNNTGETEVETDEVTVVIGGAPPTPPPPPDDPSDPLTKAIKESFDADAAPDKKTQAKTLASLYRVGRDTAEDPAVKNLGELFAVMKKASGTLLPAGSLKKVQETISVELKTKLGSETAKVLSDDLRKAAREQFLRIATILEALSK